VNAGLLELDPLPFPPGLPGWQLWSERFTPPTGLDLLGAVPTEKAWLLPCPSCLQGWALLLPSAADPFGYDINLTAGCSRACEPEAVAWWWLWRRGELPPPEPPDERAIRYARGVVRKQIAAAKADPRRAAYETGRWCRAAALDPALALAAAATEAGVQADTLLQPFQAGLAAPAQPRLQT
jgi:hypothetical protein